MDVNVETKRVLYKSDYDDDSRDQSDRRASRDRDRHEDRRDSHTEDRARHSDRQDRHSRDRHHRSSSSAATIRRVKKPPTTSNTNKHPVAEDNESTRTTIPDNCDIKASMSADSASHSSNQVDSSVDASELLTSLFGSFEQAAGQFSQCNARGELLGISQTSRQSTEASTPSTPKSSTKVVPEFSYGPVKKLRDANSSTPRRASSQQPSGRTSSHRPTAPVATSHKSPPAVTNNNNSHDLKPTSKPLSTTTTTTSSSSSAAASSTSSSKKMRAPLKIDVSSLNRHKVKKEPKDTKDVKSTETAPISPRKAIKSFQELVATPLSTITDGPFDFGDDKTIVKQEPVVASATNNQKEAKQSDATESLLCDDLALSDSDDDGADATDAPANTTTNKHKQKTNTKMDDPWDLDLLLNVKEESTNDAKDTVKESSHKREAAPKEKTTKAGDTKSFNKRQSNSTSKSSSKKKKKPQTPAVVDLIDTSSSSSSNSVEMLLVPADKNASISNDNNHNDSNSNNNNNLEDASSFSVICRLRLDLITEVYRTKLLSPLHPPPPCILRPATDTPPPALSPMPYDNDDTHNTTHAIAQSNHAKPTVHSQPKSGVKRTSTGAPRAPSSSSHSSASQSNNNHKPTASNKQPRKPKADQQKSKSNDNRKSKSSSKPSTSPTKQVQQQQPPTPPIASPPVEQPTTPSPDCSLEHPSSTTPSQHTTAPSNPASPSKHSSSKHNDKHVDQPPEKRAKFENISGEASEATASGAGVTSSIGKVPVTAVPPTVQLTANKSSSGLVAGGAVVTPVASVPVGKVEPMVSVSAPVLAPPRPAFVEKDDNLRSFEYYQNEMGRPIKKQAYGQSNKMLRVIMYLEAVVYFIGALRRIRKDCRPESSRPYLMLKDTSQLLRDVTNRFLTSWQQNEIPGKAKAHVHKVHVLSLRAQSILMRHMYATYKDKTLRYYQFLVDNATNSTANPAPLSLDPTTCDAAANSPTPSPASSTSSQHSAPPGFVMVPHNVDQIQKSQLNFLHNLMFADHWWSQADQKTLPEDREFFSHLDKICGALRHDSSPYELSVYLLTAVHWLKDLLTKSSSDSSNSASRANNAQLPPTPTSESCR